MRETYISASSLSVRDRKRQVLHSLHFQINSGETICLLGELESGRNDFYQFLLGRYESYEGNFKPAPGITQDSILEIPELEAAENPELSSLTLLDFLFLVRVKPLPSFIFDSRGYKQKALALFSETGLRNNPLDTVSSLSKAGFIKLCLAKALDLKARIVLFRCDFKALDSQERSELFSLLEAMKKRGMSFVINLDSFSSALVPEAVYWVFHGGTITRKGEEPALLVRRTAETVQAAGEENSGEELLRIGRAVLCKGDVLLISRAGLRLQQALLEHLSGEQGRKDLLLVDKLGEERLFPGLSLEDNLLMASYPKVCGKLGLLPRSAVYDVVLREWADGEGIKGKKLRDLSIEEQVSLQLESLRIRNAGILVFFEPFLHLDDKLRGKVISFFSMEQRRGKGILVLSASDYEGSWYSRKIRLSEGEYL